MPTGHYLSLYIYQENLVVKIPKIAKNGQKTGMKKTEKILTVSSYPSLMAIRVKTPTRGTAVVTGVSEDITSMSCKISKHAK